MGFRLSCGRTLRTTPVFEEYWRFASERQAIFCRRLVGAAPPWTENVILRTYRFTNPYRASDRVSQFLIRNVIYQGDPSPEEVVFRVILFKFFNRIETWELLVNKVGPPSWRNFNLDRYNNVLDVASESGERLYSAAYIMPNPPFGRVRKHTNHLILIARMMTAGIASQIMAAKSLQQVFQILRSFPSIGDFLAFQYAIDLNYSEMLSFSEMDFVFAGPGARSGIRKSFGDAPGLSKEDLIREVTNAVPREFAFRGLGFRTLGGRPLQLIDCQNLFCELDKYARAAYPEFAGNGRTRIKRKFVPTSGPVMYWYPPKWQIGWPLRKTESDVRLLPAHLACASTRTSSNVADLCPKNSV